VEAFSLPTVAHAPHPDRAALERRAKGLARLGLGWHVIEAAVAIVAGLVASSIALIGFGADSLIEVIAGVVLLWRFGTRRAGAERRAQQLIAFSFVVIAAYVGIEAVRALAGGTEPDASAVGIGLSALTLVTMPLLARAKQRVAAQLHSSATASEARQTVLCAYLSGALLVGLVGNAALGWWWMDPGAALVIAGASVREARNAWRGEACCHGHCHAAG
jgi:divalent metal cation (Fe/Co/Zn/Cd) transporter